MALTIQFANNASGTISGSINNTSDPVTFSVTTGHGARFPTLSGSQYFFVTLKDNSSGNMEVMKVTSHAAASDSMTASRAQEAIAGVAATKYNFADLSVIELRDTAGALDTIYTEAVGPAAINAGTGKTTPVTADEFPLYDSAATTTKSKVTYGNLKTTLFNSPTLVTPDLGTPSAAVLTNATGTAKSLITVANPFLIFNFCGGL